MERLPTPANRRYRRAVARLHEIVEQIVASRRADTTDHGDLLSILLTSSDPETGDALTDQQVHDEVTTMLGGATESTAATLSWTLYEIARHPGIERLVHAELDEMTGPVTLDTVEKLPYLRRVINETLRLEGPAWMLTRRAIDDVQLGRHLLPAGSSVWYSPYLLHRDPQRYPDPERFNPDRWLDLDDRGPSRGSFIPFGSGIRTCIGEHLARVELVMVLATLLRNWKFRLVPGKTVRKVAGFVLSPSHLPMTATRRYGTS
jgi:pentalenene oxygenase